jgi:hypothetical protein
MLRDTITREEPDVLCSVCGTSDSGFARTGRSRLGGMAAQIGTDGLDLPGDPCPKLLADVTWVQPERGGEWVNLAKQHPGFRSAQRFHSTQRLRVRVLADGSGVEVATYPAELGEQARYLYGGGLGPALVDAGRERGWKVEPSPHIAYWRASPGRRLYMCPPVDALRYVACWEDKDGLGRVHGYTREEVEDELWPWLKQRGFADDGDNVELRRFLDECLPRKQRAHMRPGLRFRRVWKSEPGSALAERIRNDFDAVFAVANEPALRSASSGLGAP